MFRFIRDFKSVKARSRTAIFVGAAVLAYAEKRHAIDRISFTGLMSSRMAGVGELYEF